MVSEQARSMARFHLDLAHELYVAREKAGLSVDEIATRSGLTPQRVEMIEEGDTTLVGDIALLYDALGIGREKLMPCNQERMTDGASLLQPVSPR